jgi:hypothetical protein
MDGLRRPSGGGLAVRGVELTDREVGGRRHQRNGRSSGATASGVGYESDPAVDAGSRVAGEVRKSR